MTSLGIMFWCAWVTAELPKLFVCVCLCVCFRGAQFLHVWLRKRTTWGILDSRVRLSKCKGVQVYSLQFVSVECVSCMQTRAEWVQTSEEREAQSLGLKSSTVKIVYGLPKVINLPSLWKLIGLNILEAQWICVPAMCGHWISCCSSVPPHTHNAKSYTPDWLAPPRQWAAWWVWSVITFFCLSECLSFTVERGWEGGRERWLLDWNHILTFGQRCQSARRV